MRTMVLAGILICAFPICCGGQQTPSSVGVSSVNAGEGVSFERGVDVRINGEGPFLFGIDTGGSSDFFIRPELAAKLKLEVVGQKRLSTGHVEASGPSVDIVKAKVVAVAGHTFNGDTGYALGNKRQDGTLGILLFHDVTLRLDYPRDRMAISEGQLPAENGHHIFAYTLNASAPIIPLRTTPAIRFSLAGHELTGIVDTGARMTKADVIVPPDVAASLPLGPALTEGTISDAAGNGFPQSTHELIGELVVGDIRVEHPTILVSSMWTFVDIAGLCNRLVISIDQRSHRIQLEMPASK